jgi:lysozyme
MYGFGRIIPILLVIGLLGVGGWQAASRWHPAVERYAVQGVDVSEANGAIEWPVVAGAGADFAYATATHGARQRDSRFEENWREIAAAGMRRGAVHVWSLCQPAVDQANAFNTMVPRDGNALPAAIDLDYAEGCQARPDRATLARDVRRAATIIEAHMGKPVLLRVSRRLERDYDLASALPRTIWTSGNFFAPGYAARPWLMWRASDMRRIDGINGPVNWNVVAS